MKQKISITIDREILKRVDSIVDNVIIRNRSQAIEHLANNSLVNCGDFGTILEKSDPKDAEDLKFLRRLK